VTDRRRPDQDHWAQFADEWITWARQPGHDAFWAYRAALVEFIGRGTGNALDVGCGEGRVSRALRECGYRVTATDPVEALLRAAEEAGSADAYRLAPAADLPFEDESFDLVVAYNVLMDVEDVPAAVREMRRVLRPSGTLFVSSVHPIADCGGFADDTAEADFVLNKPYFGRKRFEDVMEQDGLRMHFAGWSLPLQDYAGALEAAGLAISSLKEPMPDSTVTPSRLKQWERVPLFLWFKARPLAV
jgi:SAM-dependent methyltransferase